MQEWGGRLTLEHDIPPRESTAASLENSMPANEAEARLRRMLLAAGFGECARGKRIRLNSALGSTTPDVFTAPKITNRTKACASTWTA